MLYEGKKNLVSVSPIRFVTFAIEECECINRAFKMLNCCRTMMRFVNIFVVWYAGFMERSPYMSFVFPAPAVETLLDIFNR